jgi:hypothetical protein
MRFGLSCFSVLLLACVALAPLSQAETPTYTL